jgi:Protein of unknown function (DUF1353)
MRVKGFALGLVLLLAGCVSTKDRIHTEFLSSCCIKPFHDYEYKTCKAFKFVINDREFTIPANFETDLASIPKIAWPIMAPAHSSLIRAAIVHDWFYRKTCDFTRQETDLIFYHILRNDGVSVIRASIMYYAVRWFGWNYYNEDYCEKEFKGLDQEMREMRIASLYRYSREINYRVREES